MLCVLYISIPQRQQKKKSTLEHHTLAVKETTKQGKTNKHTYNTTACRNYISLVQSLLKRYNACKRLHNVFTSSVTPIWDRKIPRYVSESCHSLELSSKHSSFTASLFPPPPPPKQSCHQLIGHLSSSATLSETTARHYLLRLCPHASRLDAFFLAELPLHAFALDLVTAGGYSKILLIERLPFANSEPGLALLLFGVGGGKKGSYHGDNH